MFYSFSQFTQSVYRNLSIHSLFKTNIKKKLPYIKVIWIVYQMFVLDSYLEITFNNINSNKTALVYNRIIWILSQPVCWTLKMPILKILTNSFHFISFYFFIWSSFIYVLYFIIHDYEFGSMNFDHYLLIELLLLLLVYFCTIFKKCLDQDISCVLS